MINQEERQARRAFCGVRGYGRRSRRAGPKRHR